MKTRIILFAVAVVALLSFTFVSGNQVDPSVNSTNQEVASSTEVQGGIVMEDKAEW